MKKSALLATLLLAVITTTTEARSYYRGHNSNYCYSCERGENGHIKRSPEAKREFKHSNPCPSTGRSSGACPGYVVDHVRALKSGGSDTPSNMQWQTKEEAAEKDKWE